MVSHYLVVLTVLCLPLAAEQTDPPTLGPYKKVSIIKMEADGVTIQHQNGVAKVPLEKFPSGFWKRLGLSDDYLSAAEASDKAKEMSEKKDAATRRRMENALIGKPLQGKVVRVCDEGVFIETIPYIVKKPKIELVRKYRAQKAGTATSGYRTERIPYEVPEVVGEKSEEALSWKHLGLCFVVCDASAFNVGNTVFSKAAYPLGDHTYETQTGKAKTIPKMTISYERYLAEKGGRP